MNIIAPTGVYREAYVPTDITRKIGGRTGNLWTKEITTGIDDTDVKAGFIKMAVSDEGITKLEAKNLKAAVITSQKTGAVIASHTIGGILAQEEMALLESYGLDLRNFIWTHAQSGPDITIPNRMQPRKGSISQSMDFGSGWASR